MGRLNRWNRKIKYWHDRHSKILLKKHISKNDNDGETISFSDFDENEFIKIEKHKRIRVKPPDYFSVIENPEETIPFFISFVKQLGKRVYSAKFYVDSKGVKKVTVDALIYLIAILKNVDINKEMKYQFSGNLPLADNAKKIYQESGFMTFVKSGFQYFPKDMDRVQILHGRKNDPDAANQICAFVRDKLNMDRKDVIGLYKVLIELMSNVYHHAYDKTSYMLKNWYMYAEYFNGCVRFVFVDTGKGIISTVRKKWYETIRKAVTKDLNDANILKSTFNGEFRTETKQPFRGNGLLTVKNTVSTALFKNFQVLSGRGKLFVLDSKNNLRNSLESDIFELENGKYPIFGTLYIFEM